MGPHVSLQKNGNQCGLFKSWTGFKVAAPSSENERIHSVLNWISPSLPLFTINDLWWRRNYPLTHTTVIISCRINAVPVESRLYCSEQQKHPQWSNLGWWGVYCQHQTPSPRQPSPGWSDPSSNYPGICLLNPKPPCFFLWGFSSSSNWLPLILSDDAQQCKSFAEQILPPSAALPLAWLTSGTRHTASLPVPACSIPHASHWQCWRGQIKLQTVDEVSLQPFGLWLMVAHEGYGYTISGHDEQ